MLTALLVLAFQMNGAADRTYHQQLILQMQIRQIQEQPDSKEIARKEQTRQAAIEEYFFQQKFNKFMKAMDKFIQSYNGGTVDAKAVEEAKKAWRSLEKDDGWFKSVKENTKHTKKPDKKDVIASCGAS